MSDLQALQAAITRAAVLVAAAIDRASERNVRAVLSVPVLESMRDSERIDTAIEDEADKIAVSIIEETKAPTP